MMAYKELFEALKSINLALKTTPSQRQAIKIVMVTLLGRHYEAQRLKSELRIWDDVLLKNCPDEYLRVKKKVREMSKLADERSRIELTRNLILTYDVNQIHEACQRAGHSCKWEYFEEELKTYSETDLNDLLGDLIRLEDEEEVDE
jgi:hypothetical protein